MPDDLIELESITFTYRKAGTQHRVSFTPIADGGECMTSYGIGSLFLRQRDMDRALGFHRPEILRRFRVVGPGAEPMAPSPGGHATPPEAQIRVEHEELGAASSEDPAWTIDRICIHCWGCDWECYQI